MGALDIPEILSAVFEEVCNDLEFDAYRDPFIEPKLLPPKREALRAHHPKPFIGPLRQVCKKWSEVILRAPNLRVTKIFISDYEEGDTGQLSWQGRFSRARELLEDPFESDIDIRFGLHHMEDKFQDVIQLMESHVLPKSHRIRKCEVTDQAIHQDMFQHFRVFTDLLQSKHWPRLRVLALSARTDSVVEHFSINAPRLTYTSFHAIRFSHQRPPLPVSRLKTFASYGWESKASIPSLASLIPPVSFETLTELILGLHSLEIPRTSELEVFRLPRLLRLLIALRLPSNVWELFMSIEAPALEEVNLASADCRGFGGMPTEPACLDKNLSHLSILTMHMPACWFLPMLTLCHRQLSTITLLVMMEDEDVSHLELRNALPTPIHFDKLKNLDLSFLWDGEPDEHEVHYEWFMSTFDFATSVINHVVLDFGEYSGDRTVLTNRPLTFPYAEKLNLYNMGDFDLLVAPAIHHLVCQCMGNDMQNFAKEWKSYRLSISSLKALHLVGPIKIPPGLAFEFLAPFHNVQLLILTLPYWGLADDDFFTQVNARNADGNLYLPQLKILHLKFQSSWWDQEQILCQLQRVREFLLERRNQSFPLDTLRLTSVIPFSLTYLESEGFWMHEIHVEIVKDPNDFASALPFL